jgi:class 3 adenylate cyclase
MTSGPSQLRIFINYRREDSSGHAGRLYDRLAPVFGHKNVFMDIDAIRAGLPFTEAIDSAVRDCDVLIAVIGRHWLVVADERGRPRLEDPQDFVRLEIEAALARPEVRVIPVLVQNAPIPKPHELPADLQALTVRQVVELRDTRFSQDVEDLIRELELVGQTSAAEQQPAPTPESPPDREEEAAPARAGTATYLHTDVVGSSALLERFSVEDSRRLFDDYVRLVSEAVAEADEVTTMGDSIVAAFSSALAAVLAAVAARRALAEHEWPGELEPFVRMGVHSGDAASRLAGSAVNRAVRLGQSARAGQVLVSETTASLLDDEDLGEIELRDAGTVELKGFSRPMRVYELASG